MTDLVFHNLYSDAINPEKGKREGKRNNKEKRKLKKEGGNSVTRT
jgi:hypothetical protein